MRIHVEITVEPPRLSGPRRPRTLVALAALGLALLLPAVALASHLFSDVPTSHTFHTNISNLAGAGVTAGCGGGKYCPEDPVTRGQMAGFLNRGLGRVAESDFNANVSHTAASQVAAVSIIPGTSPGALPGAKQFVHAQFNGSIHFDNVTGCPCRVGVTLKLGAVALSSTPVSVTVSATGVYVPVNAGGVIAVTGSSQMTIEAFAEIESGGETLSSYWVSGNLVAESVPFGWSGGNTIIINGQP